MFYFALFAYVSLEKDINYFFLFLELVGTKDYREPEWVTQMEEMQEALKGKQIMKNNINIYFFTIMKQMTF